MKLDVNLCCGCGGCAAVCPFDAITMETAVNGFQYPKVDMTKCTNCGLCEKACNFKVFTPTEQDPTCYAVRHADDAEWQTSRSGGIFMAVCRYVIDRDGVVFGCTLDENFRAVHTYAETYEDCKKFKGSKYVQSDLDNCFAQCEHFLRQRRWVLFSGTGCQVHGLLGFLRAKKLPTDTLITMDLVCHGVPSPGVWQAYLDAFQQQEGKRVTAVDFRDKETNGWAAHVEKYVMDDETTIQTKAWTTVFYRHIMFRESCHHCPYTTPQRESDFTIADYWGIGKNAPEFDDNKGCSLVLVHSDKAAQIFEAVIPYIRYTQTNLATSMQPQLRRPIWKGWDSNLFWARFAKNPQKAVRMWFYPSWGTRLLWKAEKTAKNLLKKLK